MAKASFGRDWFNRRKEDAYTYVDETRKAFDWESGRTNYSSYFVRNTDTMQNAAKMVGSMFRVIGVPKDTKFTSSNVKSSLNIPLHMLKDEEGKWSEPDGAKLDAFYGACIQNAALKSFQSSSEYNATQAVVNKELSSIYLTSTQKLPLLPSKNDILNPTLDGNIKLEYNDLSVRS